MISGSQSTSTPSMSERPEPAASFVMKFSRASSEVAAFFSTAFTFGLSVLYSASRSS